LATQNDWLSCKATESQIQSKILHVISNLSKDDIARLKMIFLDPILG